MPTDLKDLNKVISYQKAKIEDLETLLIEHHNYFKCVQCGEMRRESEVAPGYDDLCERCLDEAEMSKARVLGVD